MLKSSHSEPDYVVYRIRLTMYHACKQRDSTDAYQLSSRRETKKTENL